MNFKMIKKMSQRDAANATASYVMDVWSRIQPDDPTKSQNNIVRQIEGLLKEYQKLKKNRNNKAKRTQKLQRKEEEWTEHLGETFDIGLPSLPSGSTFSRNNSQIVKRKRVDRVPDQEIMQPSSSDETDTAVNTDEDFPVPKRIRAEMRGPKKLKAVVDDKVAVSLDMAKVSDRSAALVLTPTIQSLGHEPADNAYSYSSIRRKRMTTRKRIAEGLKEAFHHDGLLIIHWDGKLLEDLTGHKKIDRLPVIVTGKGAEQLLSIPKLNSGTGEATAKAVADVCQSWGIAEQVTSMCFDTTASNTRKNKGACSLLEERLKKQMLWLACRHHIFEIMLEAVAVNNLPSSTGPEIVLFKRFRDKWPDINQLHFAADLQDEMTDFAGEIIAFANEQLLSNQPRDDYKELLELTIVFLGGYVDNFTFKTPAGLHRARWMAKAICSLKIWLFRGQFPLTTKEEVGIQAICRFTVQIYVKVWFQAGIAQSAPRNDLQLLKDLYDYRMFNTADADIAIGKIKRHLWYLSEELVALALFDDQVSKDSKAKMVTAMQQRVALGKRVIRPDLDTSEIPTKKLEDFVTTNTMRFFELTGLSHNFINVDIDQWLNNADYVRGKEEALKLKVVNDVAERGVALMEEFNKVLTNDEEQKQYLLQVVSSYRKKYPDKKKSTLMK